MKVYLFNTSILTGGAGNYVLLHSSIKQFRELWAMATEKVSAIGHEATAQVFSTILNEHIRINRIPAEQKCGELGLVLKMRERIPEGTILTDMEEIKKIGYDLFVLKKIDVSQTLTAIGHEMGGALLDLENSLPDAAKKTIEKAWGWLQKLQKDLN